MLPTVAVQRICPAGNQTSSVGTMYVLLVLSIHDNQRSGASVSCSSTLFVVPLCLDHSLAAAAAPCLCKVRRCAFTLAESNNALAHAQDMQAPAPRERPTARNAATLPLWVSRLAAFTGVLGGWASQ